MHSHDQPLLTSTHYRLLCACKEHVNPQTLGTHLHYHFSTIYTIPHSKLKDKLMELVLLRFIKKNGQRRYNYLVLGRDRSYFAKKHSDSTKISLKLISSTWSSFWLTTYLFSLVDVFFNRQSAYIWMQTVLLFSPTCSFIRMRVSQEQRKETNMIR